MAPSSAVTGSVRKELFVSVGALLVGAVLVAVAAAGVALPFIHSPGYRLLFLGVILAANLVVLFLFLRSELDRTVFAPLERIGVSADRIADGELEHRIEEEGGQELERLVRTLNRMAERLIENQIRLEENVRSLDEANRELKAAGEQLVRASQLASVGTLAAGIAHEVGNPLGAAMGYLEVARNRQPAEAPAAEPIESALDEVRRIDRILRSVLEFARPQGLEGEIPTVEVAGVLDRVVRLLEDRGTLSGVQLDCSVEPGLPRLRARPQHIEQVVMNLLLNAERATRDAVPREIRVSVTHASPTTHLPRRRKGDPPPADRGAPWILLRVEDSGCGIAEEHLTRVFDPFFTTRDPSEGTGLGLSLTARVVHELGGVIEAGHAPGGGASFCVWLEGVREPGERGGP